MMKKTVTALKPNDLVTLVPLRSPSIPGLVVAIGSPGNWEGYVKVAHRRRDGEWSRTSAWWPLAQVQPSPA